MGIMNSKCHNGVIRVRGFADAYDITVNPHINTILQTNDFNVSIPIAQAIGAWQRRGVELGSGEERKSAGKSWMACALRPARGWQRRQGHDW